MKKPLLSDTFVLYYGMHWHDKKKHSLIINPQYVAFDFYWNFTEINVRSFMVK